MSRNDISEASYMSVLILMAEKGIKECIDNLSLDLRLNKQTFKLFQMYLNHVRCLDPNWNIRREFRSDRSIIKLVVDTLRNLISKVDASDLETLDMEICYRVRQVLRVIRGLDPSWSINGSVRLGILNKKFN
jgi:hypothetical protein